MFVSKKAISIVLVLVLCFMFIITVYGKNDTKQKELTYWTIADEKYLDKLVNKVIAETVDSKADKIVSEIEKKSGLKGKQHKIDVADPKGKITAADFKFTVFKIPCKGPESLKKTFYRFCPVYP